MNKVYLLCNAHIDPVWQWRRSEGIAETLSTFRVAADFCEKYDGFVFNHNESVLYEWVETYDPALFERIRALVRCGKWRIMGGWYIQPDCNMPSGESFIRQIEVGMRYFKEKFGVTSKTTVNVDPFGHTRGLVQILKKCGYNSYLFMRPYDFVPEHDFIWEGYDGSRIIGHCIIGGYNTNKGKALEKISAACDTGKRCLVLWGIGDHGGGPSRIDLEAIEDYRKAHPEVIHSGCEEYFSGVDTAQLPTVSRSLEYTMVGCFTSMVRVKQQHRALENELGICEKLLAASGIDYDKAALAEAEKALLFCQFHDALPGTVIKPVEEDILCQLGYARETVSRLCDTAFFTLCGGQKAGKCGEIPILVFNPNPYPITETLTAEFQLEDQNWNENEYTIAEVYDENGNFLPTQNEKEGSTISLDWRKRIAFRAELAPMSMNRFDCRLRVINSSRRPICACEENDTHFEFRTGRLYAAISKSTGLLDSYRVDGVDYIKPGSARLAVYRDNEDPWGMTVDGFYDYIGKFELLGDAEANSFCGYPDSGLPNVRVIDSGEVRTIIQAIFRYKGSHAVVTYTLDKGSPELDINIKLFMNEPNRLVKLSFDTCFENGEFRGQQAFGTDILPKEEKEVVFQKWCGLFEGARAFAVLNSGTYGGSAHGGTLNLTLLRTPVYTAHPIDGRQLTDGDRWFDHIDMGEREFSFRLTVCKDELDARAEIYNQPCRVLSFFPSPGGERADTKIELTNPKIVMTSMRPSSDGAKKIRLFNPCDRPDETILRTGDAQYTVRMGAYEVKTLRLCGAQLSECEMIDEIKE